MTLFEYVFKKLFYSGFAKCSLLNWIMVQKVKYLLIHLLHSVKVSCKLETYSWRVTIIIFLSKRDNILLSIFFRIFQVSITNNFGDFIKLMRSLRTKNLYGSSVD